MGRVTVKNWSVGWQEDRSFRLPKDAREELADIAGLGLTQKRTKEMLKAVRKVLGMYPSMKETLDKGPTPAHKREFLDTLIQPAEILLKGLRKRDESVWWDLTYIRLRARKTDLSEGRGEDAWQDVVMPGFHFETDTNALFKLLEKFLRAARRTRDNLPQESRHGETMYARNLIIEKLSAIFDAYQTVPSDMSTSNEVPLNSEKLKLDFIKTALDAAKIPHPPLRPSRHNDDPKIGKYVSRGRFGRLISPSNKGQHSRSPIMAVVKTDGTLMENGEKQ